MSLACDSQNALNTSTPLAAAIAATSRTRRLLPMPGDPHHANHTAVAVDGTLQQALDGGHLPAPTNKIRLSTPDSVTPLRHAQQPLGAGWLIGAFDADTLNFTESRRAPRPAAPWTR